MKYPWFARGILVAYMFIMLYRKSVTVDSTEVKASTPPIVEIPPFTSMGPMFG